MLVSAYNAKVTSGGNTLVDMVGNNNGAFGGATLPVVNSNGYIKFTGGHGFTTGDWKRIVFPTEIFRHTSGESFSILCQYRGIYNGQYSMIFWIGDQSANQGYLRILLSASTSILTNTYDANTVNFTRTFTNSVYNKWNTTIIGNANASRFHSHNMLIGTNTSIGNNNCYTESSVPSIGASKQGASWIWDATMDFSRLLHFNHKLSNAEIVQYNNALAGVI